MANNKVADETDIANILHESVLKNEERALFMDLDIIAERQKGYNQPREFLIRALPLWHRSRVVDEQMRDEWEQQKKDRHTTKIHDAGYRDMIVRRGNLKFGVPEKAKTSSNLGESAMEMLENILFMSNDGPDWFGGLSREIYYDFADARSKKIAARLGHNNAADYLVHLYDQRLYHEKQEKNAYKKYQQDVNIQLAAMGTHIREDPPILDALRVFEIRFTTWRRVDATQILDPFKIETVKSTLGKIVEHAPHMILAQTWAQTLIILTFSEEEVEALLDKVGIVALNKNWVSEAHMYAIMR